MVLGNPSCQALHNDKDVAKKECNICSDERRSKHRVLTQHDDPRVREDKFITAPAIFPNNDIKYEVTKTRARIFAATREQAITWSQAKDFPFSAALSEKPCIVQEKLEWLKRHDRDCGDLYGMLPLAQGMPVVLADHIDRNPETISYGGEWDT